MNAELRGEQVEMSFPVYLSKRARREILLATGAQAEALQVLHIPDLTELDVADRERVVDIWEQIDVESYGEGPYVTQLGDLSCVESHWIAWAQEEHRALDWIGFPTPGRTLTLVEWLREQLEDATAIDTLLTRAPLLDDLEGHAGLTLDSVLKAYTDALALAERVVGLASEGHYMGGAVLVWPPEIRVNDKAGSLFFVGSDDERPLMLFRQSDPDAYARASELVDQVELKACASR